MRAIISYKLCGLLARCMLFFCLIYTCSTVANAAEFEIDSLRYQTTGANTVKVIKHIYKNFTGEVTVPETVVYNQKIYTVTEIGDFAFNYDNSTSITLPNTIIKIGDNAFNGNHNLTSMTLPESVATIGRYAFQGCWKLKSITIPNSVTEIGCSAFYGCNRLKSVSLPNSLTTLGDELFDGCVALDEVNIPTQLKLIPNRLFRDCSSLKSIVLPDSLKTICYEAFRGCSSLSSISIPSSIDEICERAFYNCSSLVDIEFPDKVFWIGPEAFNGTAWLANQPEGLLYFGVMAYRFIGTLPDGSTVSVKPGTQLIAPNCFSDCEWLGAVDIPESVTQIGESAFSGCTGLAAIDIPESVTQIESSTFSGCSALAAVDIPESVTQIGESAFSGCSGLSAIILPEAITQINSYTFNGCSSLTSVRIPDSVSAIDQGAFKGCTGLKNVYLPDSLKVLAASAFSECSSLENVVLPQGLTELGPNAFEDCTSLASITIPPNIKHIRWYTFYACTNLANVQLPDRLESIAEYSFSGCTSLAYLDLPYTLQSIGDHAFAGCSSLTSIKLPATMQSLGYGVFQGCSALQEVMSLALTPPTAHEDEVGYESMFEVVYPGTFNGIDKDNCVLRVFESAMTDYSKAKGWRQFTHREPINESEYVPGDVNGDGVVDIADVNGVINGMLGKADIVIDVNDVKFGLAKVEGGTFNMGTDVDEEQLSWGFYDNVPSPVHQVTLDGFLISTTEVTQKLFHAVMGGTEPEYEQMNCPIYGINLNRVNSFIQRLNNVTGLQFRLPTEAEWEFAARGGNKSQGYRYSGSNVAYEVGWCNYSHWGPTAQNDPRPVAKLNPNELGIYDMSGNVWEWCQDWFADYPEEAQVNPTGPETGTKRVIRGGSCYNDNYESHCDVYNRAGVEPDKTVFGSNNEPIGIRLAMDLNETLYNRASDINNDGVVDISDVNAVINLMLGKDYDVPTSHQGHVTAPEKETIPQ